MTRISWSGVEGCCRNRVVNISSRSSTPTTRLRRREPDPIRIRRRLPDARPPSPTCGRTQRWPSRAGARSHAPDSTQYRQHRWPTASYLAGAITACHRWRTTDRAEGPLNDERALASSRRRPLAPGKPSGTHRQPQPLEPHRGLRAFAADVSPSHPRVLGFSSDLAAPPSSLPITWRVGQEWNVGACGTVGCSPMGRGRWSCAKSSACARRGAHGVPPPRSS